ncbi:methyltransferase domain-containing protein [Flavobacterium sp.]|uniref:methyltransferase domain-containing protein n=1 Tax=Flavobacterium sp. TaxID=239 RepID=UPI003527A8C6
MTTLNKKFWENRYLNNETGWDVGTITTPLKEYIDQIENKNLKILIPGAGNGYEFDYLKQKGFLNVTVIDIAKHPLETLTKRNPENGNQFIQTDFFDFEEHFDLILEQTFFCALAPNLRTNYVEKMYQLLTNNGKIAGLLFNFPLTEVGPPFGGSKQEYEMLFKNKFSIKILEKCYNSIKPRQGKELFFIFEKK